MRAHGLVGEVRVAAFAAGAPNLQPGRTVYLRGKGTRVRRARPSQDAWTLVLDGVTDRDQAEGLRGELLECPDADLVREPDSYFVHELIGMAVQTAEGRSLGTVAEVLQPGANDVYVVRDATKETLIPAIADVVQSVDVRARLIIITPLPGLLDES